MPKMSEVIARLESHFNVLENAFLASAVFLIGLLLALGAKKFTLLVSKRLIDRLHGHGFGFLGDRHIEFSMRLISWIAFLLVSLSFLALSGDFFEAKALSELFVVLQNYLPQFLGFALVLGSGVLVSHLLRAFVARAVLTKRGPATNSLPQIVYLVSVCVTLFVATQQLGVDLAFLASAMLVGLAGLFLCCSLCFGIGAAPLVTDLLSTHFFRKHVRLGQRLSSLGFEGKIVNITATSVVVETESGQLVYPTRKIHEAGFEIRNGGD